jgi:hypothetical protein
VDHGNKKEGTSIKQKNMTPKEKAEELVNKFDDTMEFSTPQRFAKQCALIACNEVLGYMGADRGYEFWVEVKQEIEKL